jgi:hypothetical protein
MPIYSIPILKKLAKIAAETTASKAFDDWQEGETVNDYIRRHGYHLIPDPIDLSQRTKQHWLNKNTLATTLTSTNSKARSRDCTTIPT